MFERIPARVLHDLVRDVFTGAGLSDDHAGTIADALVWADLRGDGPHGVAQVPEHLGLLRDGTANPHPDITVDQPRPAIAVVEADAAPGPVALSPAMDQAVSMARSAGVAWVAVRGTVAPGALGHYTSRAADYGMAAIGVADGGLVSVAVPAGRHPTVLLDAAGAVLGLGRTARERFGPGLPAELTLVFELLAGGLTANPVVPARADRRNAILTAVDISAFLPVEQFRAIVDETLDALEPIAPSGEPAARVLADRLANGVPVPLPLLGKLQHLATTAA